MTTYPPEIKAAAIADLMSGEQPAIVAQRYKIPGGVVRKWKYRLDLPARAGTWNGTIHRTERPGPDGAPAPIPIRQPLIEAQQMSMNDLILANLRAKLIATMKIAEYAAQDEYIRQQGGAELAMLFGAIDQSAVAYLDRLAARAAGPGQPDPADPDDVS